MGSVSFQTSQDGRMMRQLGQLIARVAPHFQRELTAAGSVTVRFGRTQGGGVGEWRAGSRTVMLNPVHSAVRRAGPSRLFGAAVFELLNAAAEPRRSALDQQVRSGELDRLAAREGMPPAQYYAREPERIEWGNTIVSYYQRQLGSHTHSYEFRYNLLKVEAASAAARAEEEPPSSSSSSSFAS
ncbi:hypothetical protein ACQB60_20480 [Actinomycetota bacterium Odt1-20B]